MTDDGDFDVIGNYGSLNLTTGHECYVRSGYCRTKTGTRMKKR